MEQTAIKGDLGLPVSYRLFRDTFGDRVTSVPLTVGWARDTRNDYFMPTGGTYQRVSAEVALPGSTVQYYKLNYEFSKYWSLSPAFVLNTRAELGYGDSYGDDIYRYICRMGGSDPQIPGQGATTVSSDGTCADGGTLDRTLVATGLPFFENFYAGGTRSVRGFRDNTLGPRSEVISGYRGQPLGGSLKTTGSVELIFPKLFDSNAARVSAFFDFGNVFDGVDNFDAGQLRASTGVALLCRKYFAVRPQSAALLARLPEPPKSFSAEASRAGHLAMSQWVCGPAPVVASVEDLQVPAGRYAGLRSPQGEAFGADQCRLVRQQLDRRECRGGGRGGRKGRRALAAEPIDPRLSAGAGSCRISAAGGDGSRCRMAE